MKKIISVLIIFLSIFTVSCEFGINYVPLDWQQQEHYRFMNSYDGFDLKVDGIGGLIEYKDVTLNGEIFNRTKAPDKFYPKKAILKANEKEYNGELVYPRPNENRLIKQDESQDFGFKWDFGQEQLGDVLAEPVEIYLVISKGNQQYEISIPMINSSKVEYKK